jgi:hypothetical protein
MYYKNMVIQRTRLKKAHLGAFIIGGAMVVIALLLVAAQSQRATASAENTPQRQAVIRAVTDLQGCLTCHSVLAHTPVGIDERVLSAAYHPAIQLLDRPVLAAAVPLQSQVSHRLLDAGQRLVNAPLSDDHLSAQAMREFLRLYEQVRSYPASEPVLLSIAQQVGGLEQLVQMLENQASPFKWSTSSRPTVQHSAVVMTGAPLSLLLEHQPVVILASILNSGTTCGDQVQTLPAQVKWAVSRRGPPAVEVVESIGFEEKIAV